MEHPTNLTLLDVGDTVFQTLMRGLFRKGVDPCVEIYSSSSPLQESLFLYLADASHVLIKMFLHKNYLQHDVFRIEVFKTRPGDMRGNRVAFAETSRGLEAREEIQRFTEGVFSHLGAL